MSFAKSFAALSALSGAALIALSATNAIPANAATTSATPAFATVCSSGDVCAQTASKGTNDASVNAWARNTTFKGRFEIYNAFDGGCSQYSATKTWPAGGTHATFNNVPYKGCDGIQDDSWYVTAWRLNSNGSWTDIGDINFEI
jgi:hypothetical protein